MKIGIIGTRGIPNEYGGFEAFAEQFAPYAVQQGHEVVVYCSSLHSYKQRTYKGVELYHSFDPENRIGTVGQFIYDLGCILDSRSRGFDVILQLGYTSSAVWNFLFPSRSLIVTNPDGLEWMRSKYGKGTQRFLHYSEGMAVRKSDALIADSQKIAEYLRHTYHRDSHFVAYGADLFEHPDATVLSAFGLSTYAYFLLVARLEPENNIEMVITGYLDSGRPEPLVIVGNTGTTHGRYLKAAYASDRVRFTEGVYDKTHLNNLRHFARLQFHGHSAGGTNPSLLEAMASGGMTCAHNNPFNREVLADGGLFFSNAADVCALLQSDFQEERNTCIPKATARIRNAYNWQQVNSSLLNYLTRLVHERQHR